MPSGKTLLCAGTRSVVILFEDVQRVTVMVLHAHCAENRSDGSGRASLFPDHFTHIGGGNPEPQHSAFFPFDRFDFNGFGNIY